MGDVEVWEDIKGYEGFYQVSSYGRIYSFGSEFIKKDSKRYFMEESFLNPYKSQQGYMYVKLCKLGKCKEFRVHRLVALTFISNDHPEESPVVNHKDGNKINNHVDNLEWVSYSENSLHAHRTGLMPKSNANKHGNHQGEKHWGAKLTDEKVMFIRKNTRKNGGKYTNSELSKLVGISTSVVSNIINFKSWKHIGDRKDA